MNHVKLAVSEQQLSSLKCNERRCCHINHVYVYVYHKSKFVFFTVRKYTEIFTDFLFYFIYLFIILVVLGVGGYNTTSTFRILTEALLMFR